MQLLPNQINTLLEIIDRNQALVLGREFGLEYLSDYDKAILQSHQIDIQSIYSEMGDTVFTSFHFGMLSQALQDLGIANKLKYSELLEYISKGKYIPLTFKEKATISAVKNVSLGSLRSIRNKIFTDVNQILESSSRKVQEQFLKDEIARGVEDKATVRSIANDIARKTGDWSRDFDRIVQYTSQLAYEQGKAAALEREYGDESEVYVFKRVYPGACKHCIRLYLTNGIGSEPIVFKLSELKANGSNIGKKVVDWLPTLDPVHPYCRCSLCYVSTKEKSKWSVKEKAFEEPKIVPRRLRPKVKAVVGGKEVYV